MSSRPSRGAARLAAILDALPDALLLVNCNGTVVNANTIGLEAFEAPGTALVGRGLLDLLPEFDATRIPGSMRRPHENEGQVRTKPTRMTARRTDGSEFPVEVTSANLEDGRTPYRSSFEAAWADHGPGGGPGQAAAAQYTGDEMLMLVVRDLTGTLDTEAELARQQRQTEMILRAASEGVVGVDTEGRVVLVNPAAAQLLGHRAGDLGGQELHPLVHHSRPDGSPLPFEETPLHDSLRSGRKHRVRTGQVLWTRDGTPVPVDMTTAPVRDGDQLVGAVLTFTDRRPYEALRARHTQLEAVLDEALRGPLEQLRGELSELAADPAAQLWPEANQVLHHLSAGYARMTTLVDNVLGHQRLVSGREKLRCERVGLDGVVSAGVDGAVELIGPGRAQFAVHAPPIEAEVDPGRLAMALAHLIADVAGIDSTGAPSAPSEAGTDSTIVVAAAQRGEVVRIEVRGPHGGGSPVHEPIVRGVVSEHCGVLQNHEVPGSGGGSAYVLEVPVTAAGGVHEGGAGAGASAAGSGDGADTDTGTDVTGAADVTGAVDATGAADATGSPDISGVTDTTGAGETGPPQHGETTVMPVPTQPARGTQPALAEEPRTGDGLAADARGVGQQWEAVPSQGTHGTGGGRHGVRAAEEMSEQQDTGSGSYALEQPRPTGRRRGRPSPAEDEFTASAAESTTEGAHATTSDGSGLPGTGLEGAGTDSTGTDSTGTDSPGADSPGADGASPEVSGGPGTGSRRALALPQPSGARQAAESRAAGAAGGVGGADGGAQAGGGTPVPPQGGGRRGRRALSTPEHAEQAEQAEHTAHTTHAAADGPPRGELPEVTNPGTGQGVDGREQVPASAAGGRRARRVAAEPEQAGAHAAGSSSSPRDAFALPPATADQPAEVAAATDNGPHDPRAQHALPAPRSEAPSSGQAPGHAWAQTADETGGGEQSVVAGSPILGGGPLPQVPAQQQRPALPRRRGEGDAAHSAQHTTGQHSSGSGFSVRTLGQGAPYAQQVAEQAAQQEAQQEGVPAGEPAVGASPTAAIPSTPSSPTPPPGSGRRRRLAAKPEEDGASDSPGDQSGDQPATMSPRPAGHARPQDQGQGQAREFAIEAPREGAAEGPEPLDGPNGAIEVTESGGTTMPLRAVDDELPPEPLDNPRRLLVWPEPDVSTQQALSDKGYRPVLVHSREEVDAQIAAYPAALFVDPLTGPITRTALQSLRQAAVAAEVPVLVTAGLGQATREAAYGADPAVLLKALAPRDSGQHPPRVLLVEENEAVAAAFLATLERRGMRVAHAPSDSQAVTAAEQVHPNLVVMDLMQVRRRRAGIIDWLRVNGRLNQTPFVVYTSAELDPAGLRGLTTGETVLFLAERSTSEEVQARIVDLLTKIGAH